MTDLKPLDLPMPAPEDKSARAASLRSRAAVQAGDKEKWLTLFTADGVVADPVGVSVFDATGQGHRGKEAIGAFWDQTIGANSISMEILLSNAGANQVANLITITTTLPDGSKAIVDVVSVYTVEAETGLIESMNAYWEFDAMRFEAAPSAS